VSRGPRLVLLGKQGSGKGTQAARLCEHYGIEHLSTGELFRAAAAAGTALGIEAKRYMDAGDLVPDEITVAVVEDRLADRGLRERGFVLDGFPRTEPQARELEGILAADHLDVVVNLRVPVEVVLQRIAVRRREEGRDDDTDDAVARRLELYERETRPVIDFYLELGRLAEVDGVGEPDEVFKRLVSVVDERLG
jgi:adenylate kinase